MASQSQTVIFVGGCSGEFIKELAIHPDRLEYVHHWGSGLAEVFRIENYSDDAPILTARFDRMISLYGDSRPIDYSRAALAVLETAEPKK